MKKYLLLIAGALSFFGFGQDNPTYQEPPQSIVDLVDAPETPEVIFNHDGSIMLILDVPGYRSMEEVSEPVIGLAGLRINPKNNTTVAELAGIYTGVKVKEVSSGKEQQLKGLPQNLRMDNIAWGPDNTKFAFTNNQPTGVELWVADLGTMQTKRLSTGHLNDIFGETFQWHPNGQQILAQFILEDRAAPPAQNTVPTGPIVQENLGVKTPARTYQNLLENPYDERLMEYFLVSQLKLVDLHGGTTNLGKPAIYRGLSYSPNGEYLMVQTVERPYSYLVPIYSFSYQTSILDAKGNNVKSLFKAPLADKMPIGFDMAVQGPRSYEWRSDRPATLVWVEALDKGNSNVEAELRDALYALAAPFNGKPTQIISLEMRYGGVDWINRDYAIIREQSRRTRRTRSTLFNPDKGDIVKVISDRSSEDTYTNPGRFVLGKDKEGNKVLLTDKKGFPTVFTIGTGASPLGDRPFLLKWNLLSGKQDTLFKSKAPFYEVPVFFNNDGVVNISRESADDTPNYFSLDLKGKKEKALTAFPDPYPSLSGVQKTLLSYTRKDGLKLSAILYLPKDYKKEDGPLPALVWAYPREFKTREAAGQVKGSPYRYTRLAFRSPVYWVTRGYAVLDNADMPIVGEGDTEPNDTFVSQIENNAIALIDYVSDGLGVVDRDRIGVGGHSYGAFMTANLLAHTDLFAAGIARSGAYNRTLTPFGFQGERRTFWEAPEIYGGMSPFYYADKIKTPLLITHGMDDENSGTCPVQSERLYSAIKGHGGTVRLVMLPKEFHGYRSRESVLHTFWEQDQWLETYVKNRPN